jgi:hypothetical protein
MATVRKDKLQRLNDATKKLESDASVTFDDVVQLCLHHLGEWPRGSAAAAKTEISHFLRAAARRANSLLAT